MKQKLGNKNWHGMPELQGQYVNTPHKRGYNKETP